MENVLENAEKSLSEPLDFKLLWSGMPLDPLAARAFGARKLPRRVLKSCPGEGKVRIINR